MAKILKIEEPIIEKTTIPTIEEFYEMMRFVENNPLKAAAQLLEMFDAADSKEKSFILYVAKAKQ